ncbi:methyl-accepting chemotaxis protein [Paenibacillus terrae]
MKQTTEYDDPQYNYLTQLWYTGAVERGKDINFTEPFYDSKLKVNMITAGKAFYDRTGKLMGVITGDLSMASIQAYIERMKFDAQGSAVLMDKNGAILSSGLQSIKAGEPLAKVLGTEAAQALQNGVSGQISASIGNEDYRILYDTIPQTGWKIGVLLPDSELNRPANEMLKLLLIVSAIGIERLTEVTRGMHKAKASMDEAGKVVGSLNERSAQIGSIIGIIQEISGQTKLLSLNASIEAARAGEHGRGFAVVASEIGKLALNVSQSAEQITSRIRSMQEETKLAMEGMQQGTLEMDEGVAILQEVEQRFAAMNQDIQQVAIEVQEVSSASEQMSAGSEEVAASISYLADIAKSSAERAGQASGRSERQLKALESLDSSAKSLTGVSDTLNQVVSHFRV